MTLKKHKILVVDDEKEFLRLMKVNFKDEGLDVFTATNGQDAVDRLKTDGPFSVIVADYRMPKMLGTDFLSIAKETSPSSTRIMITAYGDRDVLMESINESEVFRFFKKPINLDELNLAVKLGIKNYDISLLKLKRHRVLFVDENKTFLQSIERKFLGNDYEVLMAGNEREIVENFQKKNPISVIIVADKIGGVEGIDLLNSVKKISPDTIRIMFSKSKDPKLMSRSINEAGVYRFLAKLTDGESLKDIIDSALQEYDKQIGLNRLSASGSNMPDK